MPTKYWPGLVGLGEERGKRRTAERHAIGVFVAPRQAAGKLAPQMGETLKKIISACNKTCPCTILASGSLYSEELLWPLRLFPVRYGV
jgi:hypothetical protein